jgi:hypothetical protein
MSARRTRLATAIVAATTLLLAAGIAAGIAATRSVAADDSGWTLISFVFPISAFSLVGGAIAVRRPDNPIGWLLATIGLLFAVVAASAGTSVWALETGTLPKTVGEWIDAPTVCWVVGLGLIGTQLPLRLPDGRLPSPRWRWFSWLSIGLIAVSVVGMAAAPGRVEDVAGTANPLGSEALEPLGSAFFLVIACFVGSLVALVKRYRGADAHDRVQLRWIAFGGAVFLGTYLLTLPLASAAGEDTTAGTALTNVALAAFAALPIAIGHAILRHRLYDIDVVIRRTLVYGALTATLAGAYVGSVLLLQLVLSPSSDLAIAGSTLAAAALFRPARSRIQSAVDRRFYRRRYDAQRTLEAFAAQLRDEFELPALTAELAAVVHQTMQPAHVSLWLRNHEAGP